MNWMGGGRRSFEWRRQRAANRRAWIAKAPLKEDGTGRFISDGDSTVGPVRGQGVYPGLPALQQQRNLHCSPLEISELSMLPSISETAPVVLAAECLPITRTTSPSDHTPLPDIAQEGCLGRKFTITGRSTELALLEEEPWFAASQVGKHSHPEDHRSKAACVPARSLSPASLHGLDMSALQGNIEERWDTGFELTAEAADEAGPPLRVTWVSPATASAGQTGKKLPRSLIVTDTRRS